MAAKEMHHPTLEAVLSIGVYSVGLSCGCVTSVFGRGHGWVGVSCLHCMFAVKVFMNHASHKHKCFLCATMVVLFALSPKYTVLVDAIFSN